MGDWKQVISRIYSWDRSGGNGNVLKLFHTANTLKTIELYILNGRGVWYKSCMSIKLLHNKRDVYI